MALAENIAERLSVKAYATGVITANTQPAPASDPGAASAQILRHVSHNLSLTKESYRSNEKRTDRQRPMGRHGTKRAGGTVNGLLSPLTYEALFEAVCRGTWAASAVTAAPSQLTSIAASNSLSTFTAGGGNPVTQGFRVGDIIRFTGLSDSDNNNKNFLITGFSGASNRTIAVYPAPDTMTADTSFSMATQGRSLYIPASSHVARKFAFEAYNEDIDVAQLFTECRVGGFTLTAPPNDNVGVAFTVLGRDRVTYQASAAPFFSSPTAETTTGVCAGVSGLLRANGENRGVVTGLTISCDLAPNAPPVLGQTFVPEIFLGAAAIGGDFTVFLEDADFLDLFEDETELELLTYFTSTSDAASAALSLYLPRIKINSNDASDDGSGGKILRCAFEAARYAGAGAGIESTALRLFDTEVT